MHLKPSCIWELLSIKIRHTNSGTIYSEQKVTETQKQTNFYANCICMPSRSNCKSRTWLLHMKYPKNMKWFSFLEESQERKCEMGCAPISILRPSCQVSKREMGAHFFHDRNQSHSRAYEMKLKIISNFKLKETNILWTIYIVFIIPDPQTPK